MSPVHRTKSKAPRIPHRGLQQTHSVTLKVPEHHRRDLKPISEFESCSESLVDSICRSQMRGIGLPMTEEVKVRVKEEGTEGDCGYEGVLIIGGYSEVRERGRA